MYRIQKINDTLLRECLAERIHIYVDWPALGRGEVAGEVQFDNAWYLTDAAGHILAKDAQAAPRLTITLAEAMAYALPLAEATDVVTGAHVNALLRALHAERMEVLLAPPVISGTGVT